MNQNSIEVIVARIDQKFDDFKETVVSRLDNIDKKYDEKCNTCINAPTFRERLKSQWTHIKWIWAAIVALWGTIGSYMWYLILKGK